MGYALCLEITTQAPKLPAGCQQWLSYWYGRGRGGDVIRFAELYHRVKLPQAVASLRQWCGVGLC
jgi:hypothetical protein